MQVYLSHYAMLEVKLPYYPICLPLVGWSVCRSVGPSVMISLKVREFHFHAPNQKLVDSYIAVDVIVLQILPGPHIIHLSKYKICICNDRSMEVKHPALLENYDKPIDRPTIRPTNRPTERPIDSHGP